MKKQDELKEDTGYLVVRGFIASDEKTTILHNKNLIAELLYIEIPDVEEETK